tara:strand:- start:380 stop:1564 length:1185 start_codon:yes stop_codon:yes gene_type:complete
MTSNKSKTRIVVAMSGGVDSSVAAHILKKEGYDVLGVFMKNWHDTSVTLSKDCPWLEDSYDAMIVAEKLAIPFQVVDLSIEYKKKIVDYMFDEYKNGKTPNPDILCNREIKFDLFLKIAMDLGADYIATGHYAQIKKTKTKQKTIFHLLSGKDKSKDQSYFLCQLNQFQLSKTIFPIGGMVKNNVRKIAKENEIITAGKKDSQGLCFIGKVKLPDFLQQKLKPKRGDVILIKNSHEIFSSNEAVNNYNNLSESYNYHKSDGELVGNHDGAHYFTIGQRKGISIGGRKNPLYVLKTDVKENIVYVGEGSDHPGLFRSALKVSKKKIHFINDDRGILKNDNLKARIRYRQALQKVSVIEEKIFYHFIFQIPQKSITSGQFIAIYLNDELICSGIIH